MAERREISCINKNDRDSAYERIKYVGGIHLRTRWKFTVDDAIWYIENGTYSFYTRVSNHERKVVVSTRLGKKYLKTEADHDTPDNLLSLPECP